MASSLGACSPAGDWTRWRVACKVTSCNHRLKHTTLDSSPLDWWSARRRDLNLTYRNDGIRQTCVPSAGFEPTIAASERPKTRPLDRAANGIAFLAFSRHKIQSGTQSCSSKCFFRQLRSKDELVVRIRKVFSLLKVMNSLPYEIWATPMRYVKAYISFETKRGLVARPKLKFLLYYTW